MANPSETALLWSMYTGLFNALTDAISQLEQDNPDKAKSILIQAQQDAEEKYIENH